MEILKPNDIVVITGDNSIMSYYLGSIGVVTENDGFKCKVLLKAGVNGRGSLTHTVLCEELRKIGTLDSQILR